MTARVRRRPLRRDDPHTVTWIRPPYCYGSVLTTVQIVMQDFFNVWLCDRVRDPIWDSAQQELRRR